MQEPLKCHKHRKTCTQSPIHDNLSPARRGWGGGGAEAESDSESDSFINVHGLYILIINLGRITKKFINVDVNTYTFTKIQNQWKAN